MRFTFWTIVSLVLFTLGVIFYLYQGAVNGGWTDSGVYSVTLVLVGFGAAGAYASQLEAERAA